MEKVREDMVKVETLRAGDTVIPGHYSFTLKVDPEKVDEKLVLEDPVHRRRYYFSPGERVAKLVKDA